MSAACSACGSPLGEPHDSTCLMWRTRRSRPWFFLIVLAIAMALTMIAVMTLIPQPVAACEIEPITANTPTGIAGCWREGDGIASHYGPGSGVAMNLCTWEVRHTTGCGYAAITSHDTGVTVTAPIIDFCDCYTGTADERIVDLQYGVVDALGLPLSQGLYAVNVVVYGVAGPAGSGSADGYGASSPPGTSAEVNLEPGQPRGSSLPDTALPHG